MQTRCLVGSYASAVDRDDAPVSRPSTRLRSDRWQELDLLRGIAILGVFLVHAVSAFPTPVHHLNTLLSFGRFGVQLFYFVSSLTMCYMWEHRSSEHHRTIKFYIRRCARIAPLFWVAIVIYLFLDGIQGRYWAPDGITFRHVLLSALFLHGFFPDTINAIVPGGWSIAVEMTFYLFFPFLARSIRRPALPLIAAIGLSVANWFVFGRAITEIFSSQYPGAKAYLLNDFIYLNFLNQCPIFLLGIYLYCRITSAHALRLWEVSAFFVWTMSAISLYMLHTISLDALILVLVAASQFAFCYGVVRMKVYSRALGFVGKRSYSIYLSHPAFLHFIAFASTSLILAVPDAVRFAVVLVGMGGLAICLSIPVHRFFEVRLQRFVAKAIERWD